MTADGTLMGKRILVVEDDYLIARYVADLLEDAGATVCGPVARVAEALAVMVRDGAALDAAVLDVNLNGETSYPVADALKRHGVGFVFTTGYGEGALHEAYREFPRCEKPFRGEELLAVLAEVAA